jgi:hypothetical protein
MFEIRGMQTKLRKVHEQALKNKSSTAVWCGHHIDTPEGFLR